MRKNPFFDLAKAHLIHKKSVFFPTVLLVEPGIFSSYDNFYNHICGSLVAIKTTIC